MQCRVVFAFEVVVVVSCIVVVVEVVAVVVVLPCREHPKLVRTLCAFAWHHNGVHFFNILTSKSAPGPPVVYTFGFDMCFAPQPRARYFSTSQLPTVLRNWVFLTWKCASRHNGVQFFIRFSQSIFSTLQSHKTLEKHSVLLYFSTFSRTYIFLLLTLSLLWPSFFFSSLLWLAKSAFPSVHMESILSEVWLLNFLRLCFFVYK